MRLATLALFAALAASASAQAPSDPADHALSRAGVSVTLPDGFVLEQALVDRLPAFGAFLFVNEAVGTVSVEVHTYFGPDQRAAFARGETAEQDLAHLPRLGPADATAYGVEGGSAFRFGDETYRGVVVYGCDVDRCYKVSATGADESVLPPLVNAVAFES